MAAITGLANELMFWPTGTAPATGNFTLNASTDFAEYIFEAPEDMTLTRLGFRQGTVTGTAPTYILSLQTAADGIPDGTILGGGSPASVTFTPVSGGNNTWQWKTLDNSIAIVRGTVYAMVIGYSSGTIDGSNNCSFGVTGTQGFSAATNYSISNDAGSRTRNTACPLFGFGSSGTAYGFPGLTFAATLFNSGSTPDERANLITIPTTWWSTYKVVGAAIYGSMAAATTFDVVLYDTDGTTVLQSVSKDTDNDVQAGGAKRRQVMFDETTLSTLSAGSAYRLAFKPAGTNLALANFIVASTADMDAYFGGAAVCQGSTRTNAGAWTDSNVQRYGINPILADITAPSGGGSAMLIGPGKLVRN